MTVTSRGALLIESMNRYYEERAPWHDDYMSVDVDVTMAERFAGVIDVIRDRLTGKDVLEIACGTGNWTRLISKYANSIMGIDQSKSSLELAASKEPNLKNIEYRQADAYSLDGVCGTFDVIFSADFWSHIPKSEITTFFDSTAARLKESGTAIFIDMNWQEFFEDDPNYCDDDGNRVFIRTLPNGSVHHVVKNFPSESELRNAVESLDRKFEYYQLEDLRRWLMIVELK